MGFNTVAVLFNDYTHDIRDDGPIGRQIAQAMLSYTGARNRHDLHFGCGEVLSQAHADYEQVVIVSGNTGVRCAEANNLGWMALDQMKACLERHGYKVMLQKCKAVPAPQSPEGER